MEQPTYKAYRLEIGLSRGPSVMTAVSEVARCDVRQGHTPAVKVSLDTHQGY